MGNKYVHPEIYDEKVLEELRRKLIESTYKYGHVPLPKEEVTGTPMRNWEGMYDEAMERIRSLEERVEELETLLSALY